MLSRMTIKFRSIPRNDDKQRPKVFAGRAAAGEQRLSWAYPNLFTPAIGSDCRERRAGLPLHKCTFKAASWQSRTSTYTWLEHLGTPTWASSFTGPRQKAFFDIYALLLAQCLPIDLKGRLVSPVIPVALQMLSEAANDTSASRVTMLIPFTLRGAGWMVVLTTNSNARDRREGHRGKVRKCGLCRA